MSDARVENQAMTSFIVLWCEWKYRVKTQIQMQNNTKHIYLVCGTTMCVCTCQVLKELSCLFYYHGVDCSGVRETSQF